jgi:hypothetical protein
MLKWKQKVKMKNKKSFPDKTLKMGHWSRLMPSTGTVDPGHVAAQQRPPTQVIGPGSWHQPGSMDQRSRLMALTGTNDPEIYNCEPYSSPTSPKSLKPLRKFTRQTKPRRQAARPRPGEARRRPRWALFSCRCDLSLPLPLPPMPLTLLSVGPSAAPEKLAGRCPKEAHRPTPFLDAPAEPTLNAPAEPALDAPRRCWPRRGWHAARRCRSLAAADRKIAEGVLVYFGLQKNRNFRIINEFA